MTRAQLAHLKKAVIDHFRQHCNVTAAAEHAGVGRRTVYGWRKQDEKFEAEFVEAEAEAWDRLEHAVRQDAMPHDVVKVKEEILRDRCGYALLDNDGNPRMVVVERVRTREMNPTLAMFLMKAHDPQRYRERFDINHSGEVGVRLTDLDAAIARMNGETPDGASSSGANPSNNETPDDPGTDRAEGAG